MRAEVDMPRLNCLPGHSLRRIGIVQLSRGPTTASSSLVDSADMVVGDWGVVLQTHVVISTRLYRSGPTWEIPTDTPPIVSIFSCIPPLILSWCTVDAAFLVVMEGLGGTRDSGRTFS